MKRTKQEKEQRRQQNKNFKLATIVPAVIEEKPKSFWQKINLTVKKVLVAFGLITAPVLFYYTFRNENLSQKEQYDKETFVEGDLKPPKITTNEESIENGNPFLTALVIDSLINAKVLPKIDTLKGIYIKNFKEKNILLNIGSHLSFIDLDLYDSGFNVFDLHENCPDSRLMLRVKDDRVYVSVEFKDLQKEETIGIIDYNHWKLVKENMFDWYDTDSSLIVWDKQHNIVLSIKYKDDKKNQALSINGYFLNLSSVLVLNCKNGLQKCYSKKNKNWKELAKKDISTITADY